MQDADLIHAAGEQVQKIDYARGLDFSRSMGKVMSPDVKVLAVTLGKTASLKT